MVAWVAVALAFALRPSYAQLTPTERDVVSAVVAFERAKVEAATMPLSAMALGLFGDETNKTCSSVGVADKVVVQLDLDGLSQANREQASLGDVRGNKRGRTKRINRPAVSADSLHAIIMVADTPDTYDARSHFLSLVKVDGVWHVVSTCSGWMTVT